MDCISSARTGAVSPSTPRRQRSVSISLSSSMESAPSLATYAAICRMTFFWSSVRTRCAWPQYRLKRWARPLSRLASFPGVVQDLVVPPDLVDAVLPVFGEEAIAQVDQHAVRDDDVLGIVEDPERLDGVPVLVQVPLEVLDERPGRLFGEARVDDLVWIVLRPHDVAALHLQQLAAGRNTADQVRDQGHALRVRH